MNASTKKLTTAAVCTALAVIMCACTAYLPLSFMPLYLAAFCIFLACKRANLYYGLLCAAASIGLMFLMTGLSIKWLALVLMFAPYGILTFFIHRFGYFKPKWAAVRAVIVIAFFNVTFGIVYVIAVNVLSVGIDGLNLIEWASRVGGYPVLALIATVILVPLDFIFSTMSAVVLKKIPAPVKHIKPPVSSANGETEQNATKNGEGNTDEKQYDIFGYEIDDKNKSDNKKDGE